MKTKLFRRALLSLMMCAMVSCGTAGTGAGSGSGDTNVPENTAESADGSLAQTGETADASEDTEDFRIGIVTGSFSQSEDDRRGAEAFQERYGSDRVTLAIYPDNFSDEAEMETTIQIIVNLANDPKMKAIVVNQAVDGTAEAFRRIKEMRPDILCIAGEAYEDFSEIGPHADLVVSCDFIDRGYLIIHTAHELGCDTFVHISFPRHLSYETVARRVAVMQATCEEFGMKFVMEEAPDPTLSDVGVPGSQSYILEHVPAWAETYGQGAAYFCTNDAHTDPLIEKLLECGGYFIEADLPSPLMGYPGALDLDFSEDTGDFAKILQTVEKTVVEKGGAGRFGTWAYSYGYTTSAGLAAHAGNVILGESNLTDIDDIAKAYGMFSPEAEWNGSKYTDAASGKKEENIVLIYQDTYIFGEPGYYMGSTKVEIPEQIRSQY